MILSVCGLGLISDTNKYVGHVRVQRFNMTVLPPLISLHYMLMSVLFNLDQHGTISLVNLKKSLRMLRGSTNL